MKKRKARLLFTLSVALLSVLTMSVTTFAWFQAQANVNIAPTSEDCEITVSAPDNFEVHVKHYYYTGNNYDSVPSGYTNNPSFTIGTNFAEVTTSSQKSLSNLYPGSKMTFAIEVYTGETPSDLTSSPLESLYLKIIGLSSDNAGSCSSRYDITNEGSIALARAIKIYTGYSETTSAPTPLTSSFSYVSGQADYKILSVDSGVPQTAYIFYTIEFSNDVKFSEYTAADGSSYIDTTPAYASTSSRYFAEDDSYGDSNAFENLSFSIPRLDVTVNS